MGRFDWLTRRLDSYHRLDATFRTPRRRATKIVAAARTVVGRSSPPEQPQQPTESPDERGKLLKRWLVALSAIVLAEPLPDQLLIRLRFTDGLSHAQIAKRLKVTEAASRKRLERLLGRLRRKAAGDPHLKELLKG